MTESEGQYEVKKRPTALLHIPVWAVFIGLIVVIALFFLTLTPNPKDVALLHTVGLTATQRENEIAGTQAESALNEQRTATEASRVTATPTPTPTPLSTSTPTPTETPAMGVGSYEISQVDGMKILYVPAGSFPMGLDSKDKQNGPVHEVYLDSYWIDQTEISNEMYANCVAAGNCTEPAAIRSTNVREYYGNPNHSGYPVIYVSWFQAKEYCEWAGRQLPTEAQWEKAARGEDGRSYPWGDLLEDGRGNFRPLENGYKPIGSFPSGASPYGALNMAGNVFEWTADWFGEDYYQGVETWMNPTGPSEGEKRSLRGGLYRTTNEKQPNRPVWLNSIMKSGYDITVNSLSGYRMSLKPEGVNHLIGFRCSMPGN